MANSIRNRSEVPVEHTWKVEDLYTSDEAWEQELATVENDKQELASFAGRLAESPETLLAYLTKMEQTEAKASLLGNYASRRADVDTRDAVYQAMSGKFMSVVVGLGAATSFETPEIMAISDETLDGFYAACPELERYRRYLNDMRRKKDHVLSPEEEKLLAAAGEMSRTPQSIYNVFANADMSFPAAFDSEGKEHPLAQGNFVTLQSSPDRVLRQSSYEYLYHSFAGF